MITTIILSAIGILVALGSLIYNMLRNFKADFKKDIDTTLNSFVSVINIRFDRVEKKIEKIDQRLDSIESRLSRLEGGFVERGNWEGKLYSMSRNITNHGDKGENT
jgi:hypothetical protein